MQGHLNFVLIWGLSPSSPGNISISPSLLFFSGIFCNCIMMYLSVRVIFIHFSVWKFISSFRWFSCVFSLIYFLSFSLYGILIIQILGFLDLSSNFFIKKYFFPSNLSLITPPTPTLCVCLCVCVCVCGEGRVGLSSLLLSFEIKGQNLNGKEKGKH